MSASGTRFELRCNYFLPVVSFDVKHVHVVHPMDSVVSSEVNDFWVNKTSCGWNSCTWHVSAHFWLAPGQRFGVQIKDVVQLPKLVWLTSKDKDLFIKGNGRVLQATVRSLSMSCDWSAPLKALQVQDQELIEPVLAVSTSKHKHLVVDNGRCVELPHRSFASDDGRDVEAELVNSLFEINENDIRQNLESVPSSINDDLRTIPDLWGVTHSWLRKLMLVHLRLGPCLFLCNNVSIRTYLPVSKMKMSLTMRFLPSPSLPPKIIRY